MGTVVNSEDYSQCAGHPVACAGNNTEQNALSAMLSHVLRSSSLSA